MMAEELKSHVDTRRGVVSVEYKYERENRVGYALFGTYYIKYNSILKSKPVYSWIMLLCFCLSVISIIGNIVWNVEIMNLVFIVFLYVFIHASLLYDRFRARESILQFESGVNMLLGVSALVNMIITSTTSATIVFAVILNCIIVV
mmetsp:Transcript_1922/g.2869  ORF Transcript_1922/g.2869 Transcript_1922/m.2869 type:complete len:146 (-) Transcript_1922:721-1158(-)